MDTSKLGNNQIQDILKDEGYIDENGNCPYTCEELFRGGIEWYKEKLSSEVNKLFTKYKDCRKNATDEKYYIYYAGHLDVLEEIKTQIQIK